MIGGGAIGLPGNGPAHPCRSRPSGRGQVHRRRGSRITCAGSIFGWKITFLVWVARLVITPARPTRTRCRRWSAPRRSGDAGRIGARPPVADIPEIPHRSGLALHEGHDLAAIERRAAAERDDAVMAARAAPASPSATLASVGLPCTPEKTGPAGPWPDISDGPRRDRQRDQFGVGDETGPGCLRSGRFAQFRDASRAESMDRGRVAPVSSERHGSASFR